MGGEGVKETSRLVVDRLKVRASTWVTPLSSHQLATGSLVAGPRGAKGGEGGGSERLVGRPVAAVDVCGPAAASSLDFHADVRAACMLAWMRASFGRRLLGVLAHTWVAKEAGLA